MTLLIFKMSGKTFATTSWTAEPSASDTEVKVVFLSEHIDTGTKFDHAYLPMSMAEFLSMRNGDVIDLRAPPNVIFTNRTVPLRDTSRDL